jgi:nucleotide-binding universal stress UspA family protein
MYQRILVPIDGSTTSSKGLDEAIKLAKLTLRSCIRCRQIGIRCEPLIAISIAAPRLAEHW